MPCTKTFLRMLTVVAVFGLATLALPLSAQAGARVSIGIGIPVSPAPAVVAPAPAVVYPAPVIVTPPVVYGASSVRVKGPYGHRLPPASGLPSLPLPAAAERRRSALVSAE